MRGPGGQFNQTSFNRNTNVNINNVSNRGLGWRNNYAGLHRNWNGGGWGGGGWNGGWGGRGWHGGGWNNRWGGGGWNNGWGGGGWGGGGWNNGWGFGNGFGWGLGLGLGSSLGWGLGGWGLGGWGLGGLGWGNGLGWGWGNGLGWGWGGGWGLGGLGWGGGWGLGGLGWGLSSWSYGPMLYDWGYSSYVNPYYVVPQTVVVQQPVYDYSQPINPAVPPPDETVVNSADDLFDKGREAFKSGMYSAALDFTDQALRQMPNDPTLHEFRALSLFAVKRFDDAAAALYPVLSLGPGWDWATLIGLYGDDATTYTNQLRTLEMKVKEDPNSAPSHFLLGYHYLSQGHGEEALAQFRQASKLQPRDTLSAKIVEQLDKARRDALGPQADARPAEAAPAPALAPPTAEPLPTVAVRDNAIEGTWTALPGDDTKIILDLTQAGRFTWGVEHAGSTKKFQGVRTFGGGILTLVQDAGDAQPPMVGRVGWKDEDHFVFHLMGTGGDDPGLSFSRSR